MENRGTAKSWFLLALTLGCSLVSGCTSTPKLKPTFQPVAEQEKIQKTIAVLYASEFREYKPVADPYHNKHNVEFLVGAASLDLFRAVFSRTFREVRELDTPAQGEESVHGVDAINQPKIKCFHFYCRLAGHRNYWTDITYEIDIATADGGQKTAWYIRGAGEGNGDPLFDEERSLANPVELAMQDAASQYAFTDVVLKEGDMVKGVLFFSFGPEILYTTNVFLTVPVVALDSATRYVLKVPVS